MAHESIDVRGLNFVVLRPRDLPESAWDEYTELERRGYTADFANRTPEEIDHFLDVDGNPSFKARRLDPNTTVGNRFYAGQEFFSPKLVLALTEHGDMVASAYSVGNVSGGSSFTRQLKHLSPVHNYTALHSVVEAPEFQERGLMEVLVALSFHGLRRFKPSAVYPLVEEKDFLFRMQNIGYRLTTEQPEPKSYFGTVENGHQPGWQLRYAVRAGQLVIWNVWGLPGGNEALEQARNNLRTQL